MTFGPVGCFHDGVLKGLEESDDLPDHAKGVAEAAFRTKKAVEYLAISTQTVHELSE